MIHGATFASRFLEALQPTLFAFYGTPGREVIEAAAPFNPIVMKLASGVMR
jgi:hypothetical protein